MKIKCLVVDDEPLAQRVLEKYISSLSSLELVKKCNNALEASSYLHQHHVDVMFLDIKMPELTGMEFLKTLNHPPQVIITTAYSEYALEGYEFSVLDYLLKPISFERFLKAINKIKRKQLNSVIGRPKPETKMPDFVFLKSDQTLHKVQFKNIIYLQGYGNYIKVFIGNKKILISETMNNMEKKLPQNLFVRVHKSYIVSIQEIDKIIENKIKIQDNNIPIGRTYKSRINEIIKKYNISESD